MFESGLRPHRMQIESLKSGFFVSEITHIRAVYRPARKAVQYSSFCSRWSQVCSGWKLHRPHYVGRVVSAMLLERFDHVAQVANIKRRHFVSTPTLVNIQ